MMNEIKKEAEGRMDKSIKTLQSELTKLRTGRAHPSLIEHIKVSYYGNPTPLNQVANVTVADARTLNVAPWEKSMVQEIEKAIRISELGLNPATSGQIIRIPLPPLTEERRKDLIKLVKQEAENSRVAIRNVRRDANNRFKELLKDKKISEDEERKAQDNMQKLTDKFIEEVDKLVTLKEQEVMEI